MVEILQLNTWPDGCLSLSLSLGCLFVSVEDESDTESASVHVMINQSANDRSNLDFIL